MHNRVYENVSPMTVTFTLYSESVTPISLAKSVIETLVDSEQWTLHDIAEFAKYLEVYTRYHVIKEENNYGKQD